MIDNKFIWDNHVDSMIKKLNQRMYFLRKLRSFGIKQSILQIFYSSSLEGLIVFGITCYGCNLQKQYVLRINRVIKKASKVIGCELNHFEILLNTCVRKKAEVIVSDPLHPLQLEFERFVRSTRCVRYKSKKARTDMYKNSFVPTAVRVLNRHASKIQN